MLLTEPGDHVSQFVPDVASAPAGLQSGAEVTPLIESRALRTVALRTRRLPPTAGQIPAATGYPPQAGRHACPTGRPSPSRRASSYRAKITDKGGPAARCYAMVQAPPLPLVFHGKTSAPIEGDGIESSTAAASCYVTRA